MKVTSNTKAGPVDREYVVDLKQLFPDIIAEAETILRTGSSTAWVVAGSTSKAFAIKTDGVERYLSYAILLQRTAWALANTGARSVWSVLCDSLGIKDGAPPGSDGHGDSGAAAAVRSRRPSRKRPRSASSSSGRQSTSVGQAPDKLEKSTNEQGMVEHANKMRPFSLFPVCKLGPVMLALDHAHASELLSSIAWETRQAAAKEHGARPEVLERLAKCTVERWWERVYEGGELVRRIIASTDRVTPPEGTQLTSVLTDGATAVLRFKWGDRPPRPHAGARALWSPRAEAEQALRAKPLPEHVISRPVHQWSGTTTIPHLAQALDKKLGSGRAARELLFRVIGVDPGKKSVLYSTQCQLRAAQVRTLFGSGEDGLFVSRSTAEQLCAPRGRYELGATVHQQLKGRVAHQRKETLWRRKCKVEDAFSAMGTFTWRSASTAHLKSLLHVEGQNWERLSRYYFAGLRLARLQRRAHFQRQRHVAVTANRLIGLTRRCGERLLSKKRRRRARAQQTFVAKHGVAAWSRRFSTDELRRDWVRCCEAAVEEERTGPRVPTQQRVEAFHPPSAAKGQLVVVAVGDGLFPSGMHGYAPSSHMPFVQELARRPGVVVVFVDEYCSSKKCFVCSEDVEWVHEKGGGSTSTVSAAEACTVLSVMRMWCASPSNVRERAPCAPLVRAGVRGSTGGVVELIQSTTCTKGVHAACACVCVSTHLIQHAPQHCTTASSTHPASTAPGECSRGGHASQGRRSSCCASESGPGPPAASVGAGAGPGAAAAVAGAVGAAGAAAGPAPRDSRGGPRVAHCSKCAELGLSEHVAWRNRDRNGAANICMLACRALASLILGSATTEEETRPAPWRRPRQTKTKAR